MSKKEIDVPKEVRPIMLDDAKETRLGELRGARKQYRYGNLHIREYDDKYTVHMDRVDPRKNPLGHLIRDSPETLFGIASALYFGRKVGKEVYNIRRNRGSAAIVEGILFGTLASLTAGYMSYKLGKIVKGRMP